MKYVNLTSAQKKDADEILEVFGIAELVYLDKPKTGNAIAARVNAMGQDGDAFVKHVYTVSVKENPLAKINPSLWLLKSFLGTLCLTMLKKYGYKPTAENHDSADELAQDLIDISMDLADHRDLIDTLGQY